MLSGATTWQLDGQRPATLARYPESGFEELFVRLA
jgi:hypothetical protein